MSVQISHGHRADKTDISKLSEQLGCELPEDFVEFVSHLDGGVLQDNVHPTSSSGASIARFLPVRQIVNELRSVEGLPLDAFPIALDNSGNYFVLKRGGGSPVYFWDHEQPDKLERLASDLPSLLRALVPFDPKQTKLDPRQVRRVWVDPEFRKQIDRG